MATARKPRMPAYRNMQPLVLRHEGIRLYISPQNIFGIRIDKLLRDGREYSGIWSNYISAREMLEALKSIYKVAPADIRLFESWLKWAGVRISGMHEESIDREILKGRIVEQWKRDNGLPADSDFEAGNRLGWLARR